MKMELAGKSWKLMLFNKDILEILTASKWQDLPFLEESVEKLIP